MTQIKEICQACGKYFMKDNKSGNALICEDCLKGRKLDNVGVLKMKCDEVQESFFCGEYADMII